MPGENEETIAQYVAEGFATYIPGPYHPPFDWGSVYADQLYTNAACKLKPNLLNIMVVFIISWKS